MQIVCRSQIPIWMKEPNHVEGILLRARIMQSLCCIGDSGFSLKIWE